MDLSQCLVLCFGQERQGKESWGQKFREVAQDGQVGPLLALVEVFGFLFCFGDTGFCIRGS